jgi:hypothetical protein
MNNALPPGDCGNQIAVAGWPQDIEGLCLGLHDWSWELRFLQAAHGLAPVSPHEAHVRAVGRCLVCSSRAANERPNSAQDEKKPAAAEAGRAEGA